MYLVPQNTCVLSLRSVQSLETIVPSGSTEPAPSKLTVKGALSVNGA